MKSDRGRYIARLLYAALLAAISFSFFLWPGIELARAVFDSALSGPQPATQSWRWHRALSPSFAAWARDRVGSDAASQLSMNNISGTEWPLFGAVFYLRASENLDDAWRESPRGERPAVYAQDAIEAAADLLADPAQADWVRGHWGADYLQRENVFYRMLLIDALATQIRLTGNRRHESLLREQVDGMASELSKSPSGLLADYPAQTFPADVAGTWHAILRADRVLGTDHRAAATAGLRGFTGNLAPELGLPPFAWYGEPPEATEVRGSGNAWLLHHAPFVWPAQARQWATANSEHFWQDGFWVSGFREFERRQTTNLFADVDSGPVIAQLGTSASAFGLGAARSVGDARQARILALEAIAASWPLPNGRLLVPRLLSDASDAPLLGEAAMLYNLTQPPAPGFEHAAVASNWRDVPAIVWLVLCGQWLLGAGGLWRAARMLRAARRTAPQ
jgi:hypothetical protein